MHPIDLSKKPHSQIKAEKTFECIVIVISKTIIRIKPLMWLTLFGRIRPKTLKAHWSWGEKPKGVQTLKCTVEEMQLLSSAFLLLSVYRSDSSATNPGTAGTKGEAQVRQHNKSLGKQHEAQLAGDKGHTENWCYTNTVTNIDIRPSAHKGLKSHEHWCEVLLQCLELWIRDHFLGMQQAREIISLSVLQMELSCTALQWKENHLLLRIHRTALHINDIGKYIQKIKDKEIRETMQRCIYLLGRGKQPLIFTSLGKDQL